MGTFGWILLVGAFLILIMVANNSWPWVWAKIGEGIPQAGPGPQGNVLPTPSTETNTITGIPPTNTTPVPSGA